MATSPDGPPSLIDQPTTEAERFGVHPAESEFPWVGDPLHDGERTSDVIRLIDVPILGDRALRHAYATYLCAFATPGLTPADVLVVDLDALAYVRPAPPSEPVDEEALGAAIKSLGAATSLVLPAALNVEFEAPRPEHIAAARLGSEPHTDADAPLSFNGFVEQLHAVLAS